MSTRRTKPPLNVDKVPCPTCQQPFSRQGLGRHAKSCQGPASRNITAGEPAETPTATNEPEASPEDALYEELARSRQIRGK